MGERVKSSSAEHRRGQVVEAAFERIAVAGLEGLRLRDVAKAVGLDQSTLHYYVATKEDLIRLVVSFTTDQLWPTLESRDGHAGPVGQHLRRVAELMRQRPELFVVLAECNLRAMRDPAVRAIVAEHDAQWRAVLTERIGEEADTAVLDVESCTELVIAAIKGAAFARSPAEPLEQLGRLLAAHSRRLLR